MSQGVTISMYTLLAVSFDQPKGAMLHGILEAHQAAATAHIYSRPVCNNLNYMTC